VDEKKAEHGWIENGSVMLGHSIAGPLIGCEQFFGQITGWLPSTESSAGRWRIRDGDGNEEDVLEEELVSVLTAQERKLMAEESEETRLARANETNEMGIANASSSNSIEMDSDDISASMDDISDSMDDISDSMDVESSLGDMDGKGLTMDGVLPAGSKRSRSPVC
jgi:hypothetical protein